MDSDFKDWKSLPAELLQAMLQLASTKCSTFESCNLALVCKAWKNTAQAVSYSNISINTISQLRKFHNIIVQSSYLGNKIKTLDLQSVQEIDRVEAAKLLKGLLTTSTPNLEILYYNGIYTHVPELHTLLNTRLKHMKRLTLPRKFKNFGELVNYVKCVESMKDRLENISILRTDDLYLPQEVDDEYQRLYNDLTLYSNLVHICINKKTNDGIDVLEYVTEACQSLKSIELYLSMPATENHPRLHQSRIDVSISTMSVARYIPKSNIECLEIIIDFFDDYRLLFYLIRKFPGIRKLTLSLKQNTLLLDQHAVTQLLEYVSTIDEFSVYGLSVNQNNLVEVIGNFWERKSKLGGETVHVIHSDFYPMNTKMLLELEKTSRREEIKTILKYPTDPDVESGSSYVDFIEKNGKFIGTMYFNDAEQNHYIHGLELPGNFFHHTLAHCANLKSLIIRGATIKHLCTLNVSNVEYHKRTMLDELYFQYCDIKPGMLAQLSLLLYEITNYVFSTIYVIQ